MSQHGLNRDFWSWQIKNLDCPKSFHSSKYWRLDCQKSLNRSKTHVSKVKKVSIGSKTDVLTVKKFSTVKKVSTVQKKSLQLINQCPISLDIRKFQFLIRSRSRISISTVQKTRLDMSRSLDLDCSHLKKPPSLISRHNPILVIKICPDYYKIF